MRNRVSVPTEILLEAYDRLDTTRRAILAILEAEGYSPDGVEPPAPAYVPEPPQPDSQPGEGESVAEESAPPPAARAVVDVDPNLAQRLAELLPDDLPEGFTFRDAVREKSVDGLILLLAQHKVRIAQLEKELAGYRAGVPPDGGG